MFHPQIEDGCVKHAFAYRLDTRFAIGANNHFVAQPRQFRTHEFAEVGFVVHEQNS
jgi:hypothetical protein